MSGGAVLYHEPTITTVLSQSAFILALNVVDFILDKAIYCGLVGQILIGMAFGTPGADVLGMGFQKAITDIGYLGLVLLVFEGGLSTDVQSLSQNLVLSTVVALTGILLPIAISFVLIKMCHATVLQAFAAGCALSSTSLGTTFTILKSSGLTNSRLGVILTSAAMLDDVVGLVLVQVISNLGKPEDGGVSAATVIRPVFVSIAYAVPVPVVIFFKKRLPRKQSPKSLQYGRILSLITSQHGKLMLQTALLLGAITSASYAGTSVLFAAYLAGLLIASFGNVGAEPDHSSDHDDATETNGTTATVFEPAVVDSAAEAWEMVPSQGSACQSPEAQAAANLGSQKVREDLRGEQQTQTAFVDIGCRTEPPESRHTPSVYEGYYANVVDRILKPFFFVSHYQHPTKKTTNHLTELHRFLHSNHKALRPTSALARCRLRRAYGNRKAYMWALARSILEVVLNPECNFKTSENVETLDAISTTVIVPGRSAWKCYGRKR